VYRCLRLPTGNRHLFDATLTDIEFKNDFVHQQSEWLQELRGADADLCVDGLEPTLASRLLALLGVQ
jgi:hypothetical protein